MPAALPLLSREHAVFLDYDGTLVSFESHAAQVFLPERRLNTLRTLFQHLDEGLCIISGRDVRNLSQRVPKDVWRAGSHGLEYCLPDHLPNHPPAPAPHALLQAVRQIAGAHTGAEVEVKGEVIALHYRHAPDARAALLDAMTQAVSGFDDYSLQQGKLVFEAKPYQAHKGRCIETLMTLSPFQDRTPIMVGDDATDEDAIETVNQLGGWSVRIGAGETSATYRLDTPEDVWCWIEASIASG